MQQNPTARSQVPTRHSRRLSKHLRLSIYDSKPLAPFRRLRSAARPSGTARGSDGGRRAPPVIQWWRGTAGGRGRIWVDIVCARRGAPAYLCARRRSSGGARREISARASQRPRSSVLLLSCEWSAAVAVGAWSRPRGKVERTEYAKGGEADEKIAKELGFFFFLGERNVKELVGSAPVRHERDILRGSRQADRARRVMQVGYEWIVSGPALAQTGLCISASFGPKGMHPCRSHHPPTGHGNSLGVCSYRRVFWMLFDRS